MTLHFEVSDDSWRDRDFIVMKSVITNNGDKPVYLWKSSIDAYMIRFLDLATQDIIPRKTFIYSSWPYDWEPSWDDIHILKENEKYSCNIIGRVEKVSAGVRLSFEPYDQPLVEDTRICIVGRYSVNSDDIIQKCRDKLGIDIYTGELLASNIVFRVDENNILKLLGGESEK